ncbi:MAG: hypothetical protein CLLPBCKN_003563 [Chroococcidiopsis cubana SAG 39.79]|jgi:hypothetical protein|nr:hypothetical protein [Chroococcidiopsis cubana SAG 39.79]
MLHEAIARHLFVFVVTQQASRALVRSIGGATQPRNYKIELNRSQNFQKFCYENAS